MARAFAPICLRNAPNLKKVEHKQLLEWEKEALSVHVSEHPLERPLASLKPRTNATLSELVTIQAAKLCVSPG